MNSETTNIEQQSKEALLTFRTISRLSFITTKFQLNYNPEQFFSIINFSLSQSEHHILEQNIYEQMLTTFINTKEEDKIAHCLFCLNHYYYKSKEYIIQQYIEEDENYLVCAAISKINPSNIVFGQFEIPWDEQLYNEGKYATMLSNAFSRMNLITKSEKDKLVFSVMELCFEQYAYSHK